MYRRRNVKRFVDCVQMAGAIVVTCRSVVPDKNVLPTNEMLCQHFDITGDLRLARWSSTMIPTTNTKPSAWFFYHSAILNQLALDTYLLFDPLVDHLSKMVHDNLV